MDGAARGAGDRRGGRRGWGQRGCAVGPSRRVQEQGVYRILTVPVPEADAALQGLYDVDFNASLRLEESSGPEVSHEEVDRMMQHTLVRWQLDLSVWIRLPAMINLLPDTLVQSSGDHLLRQIVRQISRRLTWKVQEDFHASHGLPCPPRRRAQF